MALVCGFCVVMLSPFINLSSLISEHFLVRSSEVRTNSTKCAPNFSGEDQVLDVR